MKGKNERENEEREREREREVKEDIFLKNVSGPSNQPDESAQCFEKNPFRTNYSPFFFESSESDVFSIVCMIRIFFGHGELFQKYHWAAQKVFFLSELQKCTKKILNVFGVSKHSFEGRPLASLPRVRFTQVISSSIGFTVVRNTVCLPFLKLFG